MAWNPFKPQTTTVSSSPVSSEPEVSVPPSQEIPVLAPDGSIDLKLVVSRFPQYLDSRSRLTALLHDLYPECRFETNIILDAFECGIARRISALSSVSANQLQAFSQQLEKDYGLQPVHAQQAIKKWAEAYGVSIPSTSEQPLRVLVSTIPNNKSPLTRQGPIYANPTAHDASAYSNPGIIVGSIDDYETKDVAGGIEIVKFRGFDSDYISVPSVIDGKKVIGIGEGAYQDCVSIANVIIPDGIQYICDSAFANCKNLKTLRFPSSLRRIGNETLPNSKSSWTDKTKGAFANCSGLTTVTFAEGLLTLGNAAFSGCKSLTEIDLPNSLKVISSAAFSECGLKKVTLPDYLTEVEANAFERCKNLTVIAFPSSVRKIGDSAFCCCYALTSIQFNEGLLSIGNKCFARTAVKEVTIPQSVTQIANDAFNVNSFAHEDQYDGLGNLNEINPNLTILCYAGTKGLEWARSVGYPIRNAR